MQEKQRQFSSYIKGLLPLKCPRCQKGDIFAGFLTMHHYCPYCRTQFEREHGYFTASIYIGYGIYMAIFFPIFVVLMIIESSIYGWMGFFLAMALFIPFIFRYSRGLWLYIDEWLNPRDKEQKSSRYE